LLVKEVVTRHTSEAAQKHQHYESHLPDHSVFVEGEYGQLAQAVSNLGSGYILTDEV